MRRLCILLSLALTVCALLVVTSRHQARVLRAEMEQQATRQAELENRWDELRIQQTSLAKASRIDKKARGAMALRSRQPERTMYLLLDDETQVAAREAMLRWRAASVSHGGR